MKLHRPIPTNAAPHDDLVWSRTALLKLGLGAVLLPVLGACSPAPMPISRSSNDPSSPSAPAGIRPLLATAPSTPVPAAATPKGHEHEDAEAHAAPAVHDRGSATDTGADAAVYVCPMHPEVTSTKAGEVCPKCNMKLVPKK